VSGRKLSQPETLSKNTAVTTADDNRVETLPMTLPIADCVIIE
jgi:hypothetical protein